MAWDELGFLVRNKVEIPIPHSTHVFYGVNGWLPAPCPVSTGIRD